MTAELWPRQLMKVGFERDYPNLAERIRKARQASNQSITKLAAAADVSVSNWYAIEQERIKVLPIQTLRRMEQVLGVDFGVRFDDSEET
ncbi:MAG: helix-turn-helix transcriptional regulator [Cyanobacteria bacterium P01_E01_bin.34]